MYLKSINQSNHSNLSSSWKICVLPNSSSLKKERKFTSIENSEDTSNLSFMSGYDAYSYNDIEGYYRKKLNLQIPAWVISKTLALLRERTKTTHGMGQKILKSPVQKKLVKSNKSFSRNFILTKFHFLQFQIWPKIIF